jgi:glycerol-3-phosphate dehydrogenase
VVTAEHARRLVATYGTLAARVLDGIISKTDLGLHFGADLYEREVAYLCRQEWAVTAEDVLWRRTKLGLRLNGTEVGRLAAWLESHRQAAAQ